MRVIKVSILTLFLVICVVFTLRFIGLHQSYQTYEHPLFAKTLPWVIAWGGDITEAPSHSPQALKKAADLPGIMIGVNVQMNSQKHFFVVPPTLNDDIHLSGRLFSDLTDAEVKAFRLDNGESLYTLEEFLIDFSSWPLLLWVYDNIENIDLRLEPLLRDKIKTQNLMIQSDYDNVNKSLRKLMPNLLYGTGAGQRVRLLMLGSLGLESVTSIDGDFLIANLYTNLNSRKLKSTSDEMKAELKRRKKIFILGPLNDISANEQAIKFGAAGYLTSYPQDLQNKLKMLSAGVDLLNLNR